MSTAWDRLLLGRLDPVVRRYFLGVALTAVGSGLTLPFLFVYLAKVRDLPTATVGLVLAGMGVVGLVTTPLCGALVDRLGARPVLVGALLVEAVGTALLSQVQTVRGAFLVTGAVALGHAWMWPASSSMIPRLVPAALREHVVGLNFMLLNAGLGVGGLVSATLVDVGRPRTFEVLYLLDGLTFLGFAAIVLSLPPATGRVPVDRDRLTLAGWREMLADATLRRVALTVLLLLTFGYAQVESGFAAYVVEVADLPVWVLGPAFAANTAAIVGGQMVALRVVRGRRRSRVLAACAAVWAVSWTLVAVGGLLATAPAVVLMVVGLAVFGLGETLFSPVHPVLVNDLAPGHLRGHYDALGSSTWTVAMVLGPAIAGLLIGHGLAALWVVVTVGGSLAAAVLLLDLHRHLTDAQDGVAAPSVRVGGPGSGP
ncbi:MFS transporter [Nocardioides marmoribigeumensis]|uniref:MFS family permease n=1 Tax=Nocardioides marmoribigeumensis TaxID=433649 RepID=A0ABU2BRB9_9ACTN|nr:MFS transporter [Nocardioides marmoribigeumensis]MDR7361171.1 MFS family permease [Nocardioides marmoribigeumensis]